jgi:hypothetical protein
LLVDGGYHDRRDEANLVRDVAGSMRRSAEPRRSRGRKAVDVTVGAKSARRVHPGTLKRVAHRFLL